MFSRKIKIVQNDGSGEYTSKSFEAFLTYNGILHQLSCPFTLPQYGVAKRKHSHVIETTIALLQTSSMSIKFWAEAVTTRLFDKLDSYFITWESISLSETISMFSLL